MLQAAVGIVTIWKQTNPKPTAGGFTDGNPQDDLKH
jgi:hypothetical protein